MTELFDASRYGPGRTIRTRKPPEEGVTVQNHGQWHLITRVKKEPYPLAHRLDLKTTRVMSDGKWRATAWQPGMRWEGAWRTRCGLTGPAIELPEGAVRACPTCKDRTPG